MKDVIESTIAAIITSVFLFGGGYTLKEIHDYVRYETIEQISKGFSSTEELSKALTGEKTRF